MAYLILASAVWAFSFGLIKHRLVAVGMDPDLVAAARLGLSFLLFAPLLRVRGLGARRALALVAVGAVQYGLMYVAYTRAYRFLQGHEVALLTIFTPMFVRLADDVSARRLDAPFLAAAVLAVAGAGVVLYSPADWTARLRGFGLMQVSNAAFAIGQVAYRRMMGAAGAGPGGGLPRDARAFGLLYLGGLLAAAPPAILGTDWSRATPAPGQALTLLYLGVVPSGLCFFLWNAGARRVNAGTLAVLNNLKIPLAVLVSLLLFREPASAARLAACVALLGVAVALCERGPLTRRRREQSASARSPRAPPG